MARIILKTNKDQFDNNKYTVVEIGVNLDIMTDIDGSDKEVLKPETRVTSGSSISSNDSLKSTQELIDTLSKTTLENNSDVDHGDHDDQEVTIIKPSDKENIERKNHQGDDGMTKTIITNNTNIDNTNELRDAKPSTLNKARKPVKFTVRKVSSETISSGYGLPSENAQQPLYTFQTSNQSAKDHDKVVQVQKRYDSYKSRIIKIDKEIEFLLGLLPPYNVEIDYKTRTKINNAIEKLKMKQDELEKKKYELGIILSRLWRGQDENDLWVRNFSH
jgi:hypothetical protein